MAVLGAEKAMSELSTYIKLNRNIKEWRWYKDANTKAVFIDLLLSANIEPHDFEKITIQRGEIATSYNSLADNNGLSYKQVRRAIKNLTTTKEITVKRYSKFIVIKILNYNKYQNRGSQGAVIGQSQGSHRAIIKEGIEDEESLKKNKRKSAPSADTPLDGAIVEGESDVPELKPGTPEYNRWRNQ